MTDDAVPSAAERLLDAAARLFYTRGVPNVGINEIIARAGVARMTFYHHFPSKDDLIKAVLERRREERAAWLARAEEMGSTPTDKVLAVFDLLAEWFASPDYRGCPLVAATFELGGQLNAARPYARTHQESVREYFTAKLREAGAETPETTAAQLHLLLEGATVAALVQQGDVSASAARSAAEKLLGE